MLRDKGVLLQILLGTKIAINKIKSYISFSYVHSKRGGR